LGRKLNSSGRLLIYVPAFPMLWTTVDTQLRHYRRYTRKTLSEVIQRANLVVDDIRYADSVGFFMALAFRTLRLPAEWLSSNAVHLYDRWLFPLSRTIDGILQRWIGKNVVALCHKQPVHGERR
jgi:hypothetical protein